MNQQSKKVRFDKAVVIFANLDSPDTFFGDPGAHKVTVAVDGVIQKKIDDAHGELGGEGKIAGYKVDEDKGTTMTFKTSIYAKDGIKKFPRQFARNKMPLESQPERNDVININTVAKQTSVNKAKYTTFYLDAIQLVERNSVDDAPFDNLDPEDEVFPEVANEPPTDAKLRKAQAEKSEDEKMPWD